MTLFWKSVRSVFTGTAIAQLIMLIGSLVIARQYAPDQYGAFSVWVSSVTLIGVLLTWRFETTFSIVEDGESRKLALVSTVFTTFLSAFIIWIFFLLTILLAPKLPIALPSSLIMLLLPTSLAVAFAQICQSWAAAEGRYSHLSYMRIIQGASVTLGQVTASFVSPTSFSLALAYLVGVVVSCAPFFYIKPSANFSNNFSLRKAMDFWRLNYKFPLLSLPADMINTAAAQLPILLVAGRFGTDIAGLLAMAIRVLGAPVALLGGAVLDVFKRHAAASYRNYGNCRDDYYRTFRVLASASIIFSIPAIFMLDDLFALAFGEKWQVSGSIAVWLIPLFALKFMASPLSFVVYIAGKQHVDLIWQIGLLAMTVFTLNFFTDYEASLKAYSAGYSLFYFVYILMCYRYSCGKNEL